jgi:hypothetical protein
MSDADAEVKWGVILQFLREHRGPVLSWEPGSREVGEAPLTSGRVARSFQRLKYQEEGHEPWGRLRRYSLILQKEN